jgi:hypothetical protein
MAASRHNQPQMAPDQMFRSIWLRAIFAAFFLFSGALVFLFVEVSGQSFWYFPCAALWTISSIAWLLRPSWAAGLSTFPVLGIAVMAFQYLPHLSRTDLSLWLLPLCVAVALCLIAFSFRMKQSRHIVPVAVSFGLVLAAFLVDRRFTDKLAIHAFTMNWSANGLAPWGNVETDANGEPPVVLYRSVHGGYCFDAVFSSELKVNLTASNKPTATVEYNVFSDFGRERAYSIHAVNGLIFNIGDRPVRSAEGYGGYIMNNYSQGDCDR